MRSLRNNYLQGASTDQFLHGHHEFIQIQSALGEKGVKKEFIAELFKCYQKIK
jgi:hypothetical protein